MNELQRKQRMYAKQQVAFGDAAALYQYRFENDNGRVPKLEQARNYVEHWDEMRRQNTGLLFWGMPGNGKTFAAGCIANALLELHPVPSVKMTTLGTILNKLPTLSAQDKEWYLKGFQSCDLLILDDFGMERQTDYAREQVFNIIDGRYLSRRPLIVTTNLSLQELKEPKDMVEQRIFDRVLEMCVPICFDGESLRQEKAREKMQLYKQLTAK